ncbi:MAG: hypothetical protein K0U74_06220 [Alphaproteobacteria bacterium]|nr:hypothetical protein [Alphaproteobacteria bacterium]
MALKSALALAMAASFFTFTTPAFADDTGMAGIHSWKKVGRKTCLDGHTHVGNSSGQRTKKVALKAAIKDWQEFTAFEYGTDWAYFKRAHDRMKACSRDTTGWGCSIEATPCNSRRRR